MKANPIKVSKLGIKNRHIAPENTYILIDNEFFDGNQFIQKRTIIIRLSEYTSWCVNSYPVIHRVSASKSVLKKYKRAYDFILSGKKK